MSRAYKKFIVCGVVKMSYPAAPSLRSLTEHSPSPLVYIYLPFLFDYLAVGIAFCS